MPQIDSLFRIILERGASDLHMAQGQPPKMRIHGSIERQRLRLGRFARHLLQRCRRTAGWTGRLRLDRAAVCASAARKGKFILVVAIEIAGPFQFCAELEPRPVRPGL